MIAARRELLPVRPDGIPDELKIRPQWVNWRLEERDDDFTKVPYTPFFLKGGYKGRFYFDDALKHVATLVKAYESVARVELRGLTTDEVRLFYSLQESIVQSIERILAAAEPPPLPKRFRPEHRAEPTNVQHQDESIKP